MTERFRPSGEMREITPHTMKEQPIVELTPVQKYIQLCDISTFPGLSPESRAHLREQRAQLRETFLKQDYLEIGAYYDAKRGKNGTT